MPAPYRFLLALSVIVAVLGSSGLAPGQSRPAGSKATPPPGVIFERDIIYGKAGDVELRLNLARPAQLDQPAPAILVIHGGGWAGGHRTAHDDLTWQFAQRGFVSATISYRFAPKHRFPAQIEDAKCAVRFLRAHAGKYNIDPERIGATGVSAGGHLSMMLGALDPADGLEGEGGWPGEKSKVQAVVSFVGPTDLTADDFGEATRKILQGFIGGPRETSLELLRKASPITYLNAGDAPMLLFQGTRDPLIPNTQAYRMAEALTTAGVPGRVELILGAGHGWGGAEMERSIDQMMRFFETTLAAPKP
jgi:acetyl esterase/lipase